MNTIKPSKLIHSKWTALNPTNREKHFLVTEIICNEDDEVTHCLIEAVISNRSELIDWKELRNSDKWLQGWK